MVVKCDFIAHAMNTQLLAQNVAVNTVDPTTWKYYLNLGGEYHRTDAMMQVRSLDTRELIDFTKANLATHRATARNYRPGTLYYKLLVDKYPAQAMLINGIISPIDIKTAIDSDNGDILYYDPQYVESNEDNLISELQGWVDQFFTRWFNEAYLLVDDLYLPTFWGQFWLQLPIMVQLVRLRNCRTPMVHSFHIQQYLASNGRLDQYIPYLTRKSLLWVYRNLRYLQRNVGKRDTFSRLVDNLLTPRGIPIMEYTLIQNVEGMPASLYPTVELEKGVINIDTIQDGQEKVTVKQILDRQAEYARENPIVQDAAEAEIIDQMRSDSFSQLPTKILDSEVIDRSNSSVRILQHVLLNEWLYLASVDKYRAYVNIPNPFTGESMQMTVKDAFIMMFFAFAKTRGLDLDTIPRMIAYDVLRPRLPTYKELAKIVDQKYIPKGMIQAIMDRVTPMTEYISTEQFYNDCDMAQTEYLKLWELYSFQEHYRTRGGCQQLVDRHYMNIMCTLAPPNTTFEAYFNAGGYDVYNLSNSDLTVLMADCYAIATGSNLVNKITITQIQKQLLKMMGQLSSYSIQYLRNTVASDFHFMGIPVVRLGDVTAEMDSRDNVNIPLVTVDEAYGEHAHSWDITDDAIFPHMALEAAVEQQQLHIEAPVQIRKVCDSFTRFRLNVLDVTTRRFKYEADQTPNESGTLPYYVPSTDPNWPKLT
jgi:hypothetical protein